jgi:hypothetical protein
MNKSLENYVKVYKNCFDKDFCIEFLNSFDSNAWEKHNYRNENFEIVSYGNTELDVTHPNFEKQKKYTDIIMPEIWNSLRTYMDELKFDWYCAWTGYTPIRLNRYTKNTSMRIHCDHIKSIFDGQIKGIPTLSIVISLNDKSEYEGGEFQMFGDKQYDLDAGDMIIFPSNFLYPHEVLPVTNGVRYSCVSWVY